ncbi:Crp/Fnr family transcriptional regulator [Fonticella tunisiensis]|uniref:Crp/Fnr family transcriptional regulator n=1 Tax=Fonticella tunisiensis TaxID=1096341 RepID=A0A4R7KSE5_9CLOT|nr:Crp/Fnr family transcriptional regulator [Fonticella tunisiensis]TDT62430.1 Crp/Fnr family transcriptional regulator [Fonticella tunisiensis]
MYNSNLYDDIVATLKNKPKKTEIDFYRKKVETLFSGECKKILYLKGEYIIKEKHKDSSIYFVDRGKVVLTRKDVYGKEYSSGYFLPGEFFGFSSLIDMPEEFNYKALTNCSLHVIDTESVKNKLNEDYELKNHFNEMLINIMRNVSSRQGNLILGGCRSSFVNFVLEHMYNFGSIDENGDIVVLLDVTLAEIASILNMTRETLSRIVSEMKRDGIIETKRRFIKIIDIARFIA